MATWDRLTLERRQVGIYLVAIAVGLAAGAAFPQSAAVFEALLWPTLAALLYATFTQVPLLHLREAAADRRFLVPTLIGNFIVLPIVAWLLTALLPPNPALKLGVLLVLLVPCTDWFVTFSQLGRGDSLRAVAVTPILLVGQLVLLPVYLWPLGRDGLPIAMSVADFWPAVLILLLPLAAAVLTERWIEARPERTGLRERLAWLPVPLLAAVVLVIAGSQVHSVVGLLGGMGRVVLVFVLFLAAAVAVAKGLAAAFRLPTRQARTLAFSFGTRNSFVVLPIALTLPAGWEAAAVAIVVQSLVELVGMALLVGWVPAKIFPDRGTRPYL